MSRLAIFAIVVALSGCDLRFDARTALPSQEGQEIARLRVLSQNAPEDTDAVIALGQAELKHNQLFEAAETFGGAIERGQSDLRIRAGLADTYFKLGYFKSGFEQLGECFKVNRTEAECLFVYASVIEKEQDPKALEETRTVYNILLQIAPNHPRATYARSQLKQLNAKLGPMKVPSSQPGQAASQPALQPAPPPAANVPDPHQGTAKNNPEVSEELNPFGQAFAKAIDAVRKNDPVGAEAAYREALTHQKDDPAALAGLAEALFIQKKSAEAFATVEKAYRIAPRDPQVRWTFGLITLQSGKRPKEGLAAWEALLKDTPEYAERLKLAEKIAQVKKFMVGSGHAEPKPTNPAPKPN